jgi:hypothetical protein
MADTMPEEKAAERGDLLIDYSDRIADSELF